MVVLRAREGEVDLEVGDDVEVQFDDAMVEGGVRAVLGRVTRVDAREGAVWVRGVRVDLPTASVRAVVRSGDREG